MGPFIPANYVVGLRIYSVSEDLDAHNNPIGVWSEPVEHPACWWASPGSQGDQGEPKMAGHDRVVVALELCTPTEFPGTPQDRVVVEGREFEIIGYPDDFNHGPHGFVPGVVVWKLKRVEG